MTKNIFTSTVVEEIIQRIDQLKLDSQPLWGTMDVGQMLAHCNVTYDMIYTDKHPKPNFLVKLMLTLFVKKIVVSEHKFAKNGRTAPQFIMEDSKNFEAEKEKLINYINRVLEEGAASFEGKKSHSFGALSSKEWNNMFYKHLDHHLRQFGV